MKKQMNHTEYPQNLRTKTFSEIQFIMKDSKEAIQAMPEGVNAGYYQDEINYCCNEIHRRQNG